MAKKISPSVLGCEKKCEILTTMLRAGPIPAQRKESCGIDWTSLIIDFACVIKSTKILGRKVAKEILESDMNVCEFSFLLNGCNAWRYLYLLRKELNSS